MFSRFLDILLKGDGGKSEIEMEIGEKQKEGRTEGKKLKYMSHYFVDRRVADESTFILCVYNFL